MAGASDMSRRDLERESGTEGGRGGDEGSLAKAPPSSSARAVFDAAECAAVEAQHFFEDEHQHQQYVPEHHLHRQEHGLQQQQQYQGPERGNSFSLGKDPAYAPQVRIDHFQAPNTLELVEKFAGPNRTWRTDDSGMQQDLNAAVGPYEGHTGKVGGRMAAGKVGGRMADASNWPRTDLQRESGTGREGIEGSIEGSGDYDARPARQNRQQHRQRDVFSARPHLFRSENPGQELPRYRPGGRSGAAATGANCVAGSANDGTSGTSVASLPAAVPLHAAEETPASIGEGILGGKSASTVGRRKALCSHWQRHGECSFGSRCHFAHGIEQSARGGKTNSANTNNTNSANSGNAANTINTNSVNTANTAGGVHASASAGADSDGGVGGGVDDGGRHRRSCVPPASRRRMKQETLDPYNVGVRLIMPAP